MGKKSVNINQESIVPALTEGFFELVPFNVAVIDRDFNVVLANSHFREYYGNWEGRHCYEVYKKMSTKCTVCQAPECFETGEIKVSNEAGTDRNGNDCHYVVYFAPIKNKNGEIQNLIVMSTDITHSTSFQREYSLLFEKTPCYITVLNKDYRIVRANKKFRDTFGDIEGKYCYEAYKKRKTPCNLCPAAETFEDGEEHSSAQVGLSIGGEETHYVVNTSPLSWNKDGVSLIIELAMDITEISLLQEQLYREEEFYTSLLDNSSDGILVLDERGNVLILNKVAQELLNWKGKRKPGLKTLASMLPKEFFEPSSIDGVIADLNDTIIHSYTGEEIPVRFKAVELAVKDSKRYKLAFITDLRCLKTGEKRLIITKRG